MSEVKANPWPLYIDLSQGHPLCVETPHGSVHIELLSIDTVTRPECWAEDLDEGSVIDKAYLRLRVGDKEVVLRHAPFAMPQTVGNWQVMVETVVGADCEWKTNKLLPEGVEARIAIQHINASWGPADLAFPLPGYRWRANSNYQNTWSALVPYQKKLYCHRGEDFGGAPDHLDVVAVQSGMVTKSPLPNGDSRSNALCLQMDDRAYWCYCHMNTGSLLPNANEGQRLGRREIFGKLGSTYLGKEDLIADPHLHLDLTLDNRRVNAFPFLVQAYFSTFDDPILPIAGCYRSSRVGEPIELDGSASMARQGREIVSWQWNLSNGTTANIAKVPILYANPGLYSEELVVRDDAGNEDRDYVQVRVWKDGQKPMPLWIETHPARGLNPGEPLNIQIRHYELTDTVKIDFGDGTPCAQTNGEAVTHPYAAPGSYTITATTSGPHKEPMTSRLRIVVENTNYK